MTEEQLSWDTADVSVYMNNINIKLKNHMFTENEPIKIFDFKTSSVNKDGKFTMLNEHEFIALLNLLSTSAETQFRTDLSGASATVG